MSSIFFEDLIDNLDLQKEYVEPIHLASSFFPLSYSKAKDMGCMNFLGPSVDCNNIMYLKNDTNLQSTFDLIMIQFYGQPYPNYTEIANVHRSSAFEISLSQVDLNQKVTVGKDSNSFFDLYERFISNSDDGVYVLNLNRFHEKMEIVNGKAQIVLDKTKDYFFDDSSKELLQHQMYYRMDYYKNSDSKKVTFKQFLYLCIHGFNSCGGIIVANHSGRVVLSSCDNEMLTLFKNKIKML